MAEYPYGKLWWQLTDEEVHAYLLNSWGAPEQWRIYGYVGDDGENYDVMDDDNDRFERVVAYLKKIGTPKT